VGIQPNVVLGVVGTVIVVLTASYGAANWRTLTGLESWDASFSTSTTVAGDRSQTVPDGGVATETFALPANVTVIFLDATWRESGGLSHPDVTVRLFDAKNASRAQATHQGGAVGVHFDVRLVPEDTVPMGEHRFEVRGKDQARRTFDERWPAHPESRGDWTVEIASSPTGGLPGSITYDLHLESEHYEGTLRRAPMVVR
jgi:hypothetical protein